MPKLSDFGLIQCELLHATVDDSYTCLSYVWGTADKRRLIKINGKLFHTRENLWRFLRSVQHVDRQRPSTLYWIDAICIDQSNTLERNHQVAQMGTIYRQAQDMLIWMGTDESTTRLLNVALDVWTIMGRCDTLAQFVKAATRDPDVCNLNVAKDWMDFLTHVYWTRAWITQEVLLARNSRILTDKVSVDSHQLRPMCYFDNTMKELFADTRLFGEKALIGARSLRYLEEMFAPQRREKHSIVQLLHDFPDRACEITRDRVHSLAFLAVDGPLVPVDYALGDRDFFYGLLTALKTSMSCFCSIATIAAALQYSSSVGATGQRCPTFRLILESSKSSATLRGRGLGLLNPFKDTFSTKDPPCPDCGLRSERNRKSFVCLRRHCPLMKGHLIEISSYRPLLKTNINILVLMLDRYKMCPITSRVVNMDATELNVVSFDLHADELLYLVQTATPLDMAHSSSSICAHQSAEGGVFRML